MKALPPNELVTMMLNSGMAKPALLAGCTPEDITDLERTYHVALPKKYVEFLQAFGKSSDNLFPDMLLVYPAVTKFPDVLMNILGNWQLPTNAFVFLIRTDMILFFECAGNDDPPVFKFEKGDTAAESVVDSFSTWLTEFIVSEVQAFNELQQLKR